MLKNRLAQRIHCSKCAVNFLCLAKGLDEIEIEQVNSVIQTIKTANKGEHIFHSHEKMNNLYAVFTGSCKDYGLDENGNERINNFYFPGDMVGLESIPNKKHLYSLVALEDTQLCVIPLESLFELMRKHDRLLKRVMNITSYKMKNDQHIHITTNANQRVADFILNILYRLEERQLFSGHISLSMSQLDIGNFLGMAHETVNRIIRKFCQEKIIKLVNKKIYITDFDRLKALGTPMHDFGQVK